MPCCWVQSPSPLYAAFHTSDSSPARQSLRAQSAEWDRDTRHNRVAELGLWGASWRLRQGWDNQCLRGKICPGRGIPAWKGTLAATVEMGEMQYLPLYHMAFPSTLSHSQAPPGLGLDARTHCSCLHSDRAPVPLSSALRLSPPPHPTVPAPSGSAACRTPLTGLLGLPGAGRCAG